MFDDIFVTEYLKIITEADNDAPKDEAKFSKIKVLIERDEDAENEVPELKDQIDNFFGEVKDPLCTGSYVTFDDMEEANLAIGKFMKSVANGLNNIKIDQKLKEKLDKKYMGDKGNNKEESTEDEEKIEVRAEGENATATTNKS